MPVAMAFEAITGFYCAGGSILRQRMMILLPPELVSLRKPLGRVFQLHWLAGKIPEPSFATDPSEPFFRWIPMCDVYRPDHHTLQNTCAVALVPDHRSFVPLRPCLAPILAGSGFQDCYLTPR